MKRLIGPLLWVLLVRVVAAATLHVDRTHPSASDVSGNPFKTIQAAIDAAAPSDTVQVASGIYTERVAIAKSLTLAGSGSAQTILDGSFSGTVMRIEAGATVQLSDLSIRNGRAENGGGILSFGRLSVLRCSFFTNVADGVDGIPSDPRGYNSAGGAIYSSGPLSITESTFRGNRAEGGQAYCEVPYFCEAPSGTGRGGAVYAVASTSVVARSEFVDNSADLGGALYGESLVSISGCTVRACRALEGGRCLGKRFCSSGPIRFHGQLRGAGRRVLLCRRSVHLRQRRGVEPGGGPQPLVLRYGRV